MKANKVVFGAVSIMDISDSTVTPETLGEGATAYDKSGEKITGTMKSGIDTSDATATASDMAQGVTAYVNGEKVTGTIMVAVGNAVTNYPNPQVDGDYIACIDRYYGGLLLKPGGTYNTKIQLSKFGDATAADVAAGKTFTSAAGLKVVGTAEAGGGSGGGSVETGTFTVTNNGMYEPGVNKYTLTSTALKGTTRLVIAITHGNACIHLLSRASTDVDFSSCRGFSTNSESVYSGLKPSVTNDSIMLAGVLPTSGIGFIAI